jgi:hypothetical protein
MPTAEHFESAARSFQQPVTSPLAANDRIDRQRAPRAGIHVASNPSINPEGWASYFGDEKMAQWLRDAQQRREQASH